MKTPTELQEKYVCQYEDDAGYKFEAIKWTGHADSTIRLQNFLNSNKQIFEPVDICCGDLDMPLWYGTQSVKIGQWVCLYKDEVMILSADEFLSQYSFYSEEPLCQHNYKMKLDENGFVKYAECDICGFRLIPKLTN